MPVGSSGSSHSSSHSSHSSHASHTSHSAHTSHASHASKTHAAHGHAAKSHHKGHSTKDTFTAHHAHTHKAAGIGPMTPEKIAAIQKMAAQARKAGVPPALAVMTALVESRFRNLKYGDRDSLGMFQQRNAWGPKADRMNVEKATSMFLHGGAAGQKGAADYKGRYGNLSQTAENLGKWAQKVQGSAYPDRYRNEFNNANAMLHAAGVQGY